MNFVKKYHIMLVEDNTGDILLAQEAFKRHPEYDLTIKSDGNEAVDYLLHYAGNKNDPMPDLILLDLGLPGKRGEEVLNTIKQNDKLKKIPVIILSTQDDQEVVNAVYHLQSNCFVLKPDNIDGYFRVIDTIDTFWFKTVRLPDHA